MYLQTSAYRASLMKASAGQVQLRATGMPAFGTKPVVPTNSGSGLAILSTDPDKQRAAWELMKFLTSEHAFQIITAEIGYLPLRTGIVNDDKYLKGWVAQNPQILPNIEQMDNLGRACPTRARTHSRSASSLPHVLPASPLRRRRRPEDYAGRRRPRPGVDRPMNATTFVHISDTHIGPRDARRTAQIPPTTSGPWRRASRKWPSIPRSSSSAAT